MPTFTRFTESIADFALPDKFTFPFCYEPHTLSILAATQLQKHLQTQCDWQHDFGVDHAGNINLEQQDNSATGKMFGVLVVKNQSGELGYLSAFSGKIADQNILPGFVPPVFDMLSKDSFFFDDMAEITEINRLYKERESQPERKQIESKLAEFHATFDSEVSQFQSKIIESRKARKRQRVEAEKTLSADDLAIKLQELSKQSVYEKKQLIAVKAGWQEQIDTLQAQLELHTSELDYIRKKRKKRSARLQKKLFSQYQFLNKRGTVKDLNDIFKQTIEQVPPAGAGECAAPKLLQYAFTHGLTPISLAEFWWGKSPKSAIRKHKKFYASCQTKCAPILGHMLDGMMLDDNPLLQNTGIDKHIEILFQDEHMLVINKPEDLLSVPGKNVSDSVYTRIKAMFPDATGPLIVHRLDMSTSGIMVLALTKAANKSLQRQFITRCVKKRYIALLEGQVVGEQGDINLPLRQDIEDRPRQLVCYEHGKPADTTWQVIAREGNKTRLYLHPKTGRTHQLRVHCAHHLGLNIPIVGDDLYGTKTNRLHLHAQYIEFNHPVTREKVTFSIEPNF